jgi:hypothetical protein
LPIGAKTWDAIDEAIRLRDKLLLILSENSIASDWVEDEVTKAFAEERRREQLVLFPVRIDDAVMATPEPWARKLRDQRNIGDFRKWLPKGTGKAASRSNGWRRKTLVTNNTPDKFSNCRAAQLGHRPDPAEAIQFHVLISTKWPAIAAAAAIAGETR